MEHIQSELKEPTNLHNTKQSELKEPTSVRNAKPSGGGSAISILALIIALALIIGGLYLYWQTTTTFGQINSTTASLQQQMENNNAQLQSKMDALQKQVQDHSTILGTLQQMSKGDVATWRFAEAKYLVQLAYYHLTFTRDIQAALSLLQTAEQRIAALNDPSLLQIRQLIANNIVALQAVPRVDIAGLLTRITALQTQVAQLPTIGLPSLKSAEEETEEPASPLRKAVHDSWSTLQKIVVIRHDDTSIHPLLSPEQQTYLQQNLQLILQQAQWAALREQEDVYQSSLKQAQKWIEHYFADSLPPTRAFLHAIAELQKINVQPALPDLAPLATQMQQLTLTPAKRNS